MPNRRDYDVTMMGACNARYNSGSTTATLPAVSRSLYRSGTDYAKRHKPSGKWIYPTSYSMLEYVDRRPFGVHTSFNANTTNLYSQYFSGYVMPTTDDYWISLLSYYPATGVTTTVPADLANRALMRARSKIQAGTVNLAQAFAERRQVSNQILQTAKTLADAFRNLRKGRFKKAARRLGIKGAVKTGSRGLANQWLALQYGWLPLLTDIHGSLLALDKLDRSDWRVTAVSKVQTEQVSNGLHTTATNFKWYSYGICKAKHSVYCRIDAQPSSSAIASLASVGVVNPATLAWELLPYSFIVDWFLPIGDYISQFDALAGWEILGYSSSAFSTGTLEFRGVSTTDYDQYGNSYYTRREWSGDRRFCRLVRTASATVPFPLFPKIKDPRSTLHMANALSLLTSAFLPNGRPRIK